MRDEVHEWLCETQMMSSESVLCSKNARRQNDAAFLFFGAAAVCPLTSCAFPPSPNEYLSLQIREQGPPKALFTVHEQFIHN
jgi:hypothetical protein